MILNKEYEKAKQHKLLLISIIVLFTLILASIALFIQYLVFTYPVDQISQYGITNATEKANLINEYRTTSIQLIATLAQILGGTVVVVGVYFAWKNITIAQEGQITERFTRAVDQLGAKDQLGNPAIEIRIGGIYALKRILDSSDEDYWPIMQTLTAYVRNNSSVKNIKDDENQKELSDDIKAILDVIRRRKYYIIEKSSNLRAFKVLYDLLKFFRKGGTEVHHTDFLEFAHNRNQDKFLRNREQGNLDLEKCYLRKANLTSGYFKSAYFNEANLCEASLLFTNFTKARLFNANLQNSLLILTNFTEANLKSADLKGADLTGAKLINANLIGANLKEAVFDDANLEGANLREADLMGVKNLTIDQLSKVKTLYQAKLDPELEEELRSKGYSHLLDDEP